MKDNFLQCIRNITLLFEMNSGYVHWGYYIHGVTISKNLSFNMSESLKNFVCQFSIKI